MKIEYIKDHLFYDKLNNEWLSDEEKQLLDIIINISKGFGCTKLIVNVDNMWTDAEFDNEESEVAYSMALEDAIHNASLQNMVKNNEGAEINNIKVLKDGIGWVL